AMPRQEEIPALEARVRESKANLADQEDLALRARRLAQQRAYRELTLKLFPAGACKMTVVAAGGILEAILDDQLTRDAARVAAAMAAARAPKKKGGATRDITVNEGEDQWDLARLIDVAADENVIPKTREALIDQSLRGYRNFVHPHKELRTGHPCDEPEALCAMGALKAICDHFDRVLGGTP